MSISIIVLGDFPNIFILVRSRMVSSGIFGNASVFDPETSIFPLGNTTGHLGESNPSTSVLISNPSATLSSDFSFSIKTGSLITLGPGSGIFDANKFACTIAKSISSVLITLKFILINNNGQ